MIYSTFSQTSKVDNILKTFLLSICTLFDGHNKGI